MINIYSLFLSGIFGHLFPIVFNTTVSNADSNVTNTPAVRKSALLTDGLTRNLRLIRKCANITDELTQNLRLVRKSALLTDDLTRNLRLIRKSALFTDKRARKIQAAIKSQQFWGRIERPQITPSRKLNLYDKMLSILDI